MYYEGKETLQTPCAVDLSIRVAIFATLFEILKESAPKTTQAYLNGIPFLGFVFFRLSFGNLFRISVSGVEAGRKEGRKQRRKEGRQEG